jgi:short-subunit dehydrogenase
LFRIKLRTGAELIPQLKGEMSRTDSKRLAVVTGASSGLGEVFARKLAGKGYRLLLVARREERLAKLVSELGTGHELVVADLSREQEVEGLAQRLQAAPNLELLVNNAGFGTKGLFWQIDYTKQLEMHELHINATLRLTRAALEGMVRRNSGGIINVASVAAFFRSPGNVSYCATKGWMNDFSEALYLELKTARSAVKIQALCPGFTYTEFHDTLGVSRKNIPKKMWMPADFVVEESIRALDKGKLFVIPGWRYKLLIAIGTRLPISMRLAMQARSPHNRGRT